MRRTLLILLFAAPAAATPACRLQLSLEDGAPPPTPSMSASTTSSAASPMEWRWRPAAGRPPGAAVERRRVRAGGRARHHRRPDGGRGRPPRRSSRPQMPLPLLLSASLPADRDGDSVPDAIDDCADDFDPEQNLADGWPRRRPPPAWGPRRSPIWRPHPALPTAARPRPIWRRRRRPVRRRCGAGGRSCDEGAANSDDPAAAGGCTSSCRLRAGCGSLAGAAAPPSIPPAVTATSPGPTRPTGRPPRACARPMEATWP